MECQIVHIMISPGSRQTNELSKGAMAPKLLRAKLGGSVVFAGFSPKGERLF